MNKLKLIPKKEFLKLSSVAMWSKYNQLADEYRALSIRYEHAIEKKSYLGNRVLEKSEKITLYREQKAARSQRQRQSGAMAHERTADSVEDALQFWWAHKSQGEELSHKRFYQEHMAEYPESEIKYQTYRKLRTAAGKAWKDFPSDPDRFILAAKHYRSRPKVPYVSD